MSKKRRMFDIDIPVDVVSDTPETFPAGKVSEPATRRGPMAAAIAETVESTRDRQEIEARIRAENDALAHEHVRLKRLGLVLDLVPLDAIGMHKLVRDRKKGLDHELKDLKASITELGLSNPIRVEAGPDGRYELIQGFRRLSAYQELLEETGDADRFGRIPAAVSQPGDSLEALYRRMVDENLVRKDISFAEMAMLALDYARDPDTEVNDPDKAVAMLFKSAGYQKRSYIRTFIKVVERLGAELRFVEEIPRALGLALAQRLEEMDGLVPAIRAELADWDDRSIEDELSVLRRFAGDPQAEGRAEAPAAAVKASSGARPARAKTSFQFDRREGRARCVAANGKLEIRLERDFSTVDRRRLEQAVRLMLDQLDG
ncbi:ParB/RepB/Spo0J family partition protein [Albidovulum sediminicola]|uniref:ParB N-terminal domain-containing protein n=1 Tax=Albidovulum sediminicola TaxID=2984331 RepID=A0ABT2Z5G1_9RHOB|nr:ParB N-terminal domain-containing protein [Defluviimonas sp. WL0075]MCV2866389.1 ParB N-terminal domain-containing protein [Defluviimonas sp. WL0075]